MRFTLNVTMLDPAQILPIAKAAEQAGFYAVSVPDSIFYPEEALGNYPYHEGREFLEDKPFIEPLIAIASMAAVTSTLHFSTFVIKLAIRDALIAAKTALSTAVMSNNRLTLGVGISPWLDDFEHCNVAWEGRGKRLDEMIEVLRGVQTGEHFEYHGEHFDFPRLKMCPVPDQPIKITVGRHSNPAPRRPARPARPGRGRPRRSARGSASPGPCIDSASSDPRPGPAQDDCRAGLGFADHPHGR